MNLFKTSKVVFYKLKKFNNSKLYCHPYIQNPSSALIRASKY